MWNCGTVEPLFLDISHVLLLMTFFQTGGAGEFRKNLKFEIFNFGLFIVIPEHSRLSRPTVPQLHILAITFEYRGCGGKFNY